MMNPPFSDTARDKAVNRAHNICDAMLALPPVERPHVLSLNEVFSEDAQDVFESRLKSSYPHIVRKFDSCELLRDSGMMLLSQFEIEKFSSDVTNSLILKEMSGDGLFVPHQSAVNSDRWACKGVGFVKILTPNHRHVLFAISHLQAYYQYYTEYAEIRYKQIKSALEMIKKVTELDDELRCVVLMGDLNIRGDTDAQGNEWTNIFDPSAGVMQGQLLDGWRTYMRPPISSFSDWSPTFDQGKTNNNLVAGDSLPLGTMARLDYICTQQANHQDWYLVPQQMRLRFTKLSDHASLEADLHFPTPHCTPSTAHVLGGASTQTFSSGLMVVNTTILRPGGYQWIFVEQPGTYTVFGNPSPDIEVDLFAIDDLSNRWNQYDKFDITRQEDEMVANDFKHARVLGMDALQYVVPKAFYIRVRHRLGVVPTDLPTQASVGILKHEGATVQTAINVLPYVDPIDPALPVGRRLGANDACWFRMDHHDTFANLPRTVTYHLHNPKQHFIKLVLLNASLNEIASQAGTGDLILTQNNVIGPDHSFLVLYRSDVNHSEFQVSWKSGITYLRSKQNVRPMVLRAIDETGVDKFLLSGGSDEIYLDVKADGKPFLNAIWPDADTDKILKLDPPVIAFSEKVEVNVREDEDWEDDQLGSTSVAALVDTDPLEKAIVQDFVVGSGKYSYECTISRLRQG
jgi:hypothetical protein